MNAINFIQDNGVDKAREVIDGAPEWASHFDGYLYSEKWFHGNSILISEINNLIESVDLVKRYGGIAEVKTLHQDEFWNERAFKRLKQAIADYEAIYSNDCEILDHPEDYTSPNCKKFDERVKCSLPHR